MIYKADFERAFVNHASVEDIAYLHQCSTAEVDENAVRVYGCPYDVAHKRYIFETIGNLKQIAVNKALDGNAKELHYVLRNLADWVSANSPLPPADKDEGAQLTREEEAVLDALRRLKRDND